MKATLIVGGILLAGLGCNKEKRLECLDVGERVKKWEEVSGSMDGLSASVLGACTEADWSQAYRKCVLSAFGGAEPMSKIEGCALSESGSSLKKTKPVKRSKTAEASQFLKKMSDSARAYYHVPDFSGNANNLRTEVVAKQLPEQSEITPPLGTCCKDGGKCDPSSGKWQAPTWVALDFEMEAPHYYSYEFKRTENSYTATAYGDLDCDGTYSTFSLYGEIIDGEVQTAGDVLKQDPLE